MVFNDFIEDDFIPEGDGSASFLVTLWPLETEEQKLEREQNERDVFETLGEHNGMSVENVPAVVFTLPPPSEDGVLVRICGN